MLGNIGLYSYGASFVAYFLLCGIAIVSLQKRPFGKLLLIASAVTALWAAVIVVSTLLPYPRTDLMQLAEVARNATWCFLLLKIIGDRLSGTDHLIANNHWTPWFIGAIALVLFALFGSPYILQLLSLQEDLQQSVSFITWLAMAIAGLWLLEQIYRNSIESERWSIKHLCLGLGLLFAYDFSMYAEALLFRQLDQILWQARGIIVAVAAVFIAIAMGRIERTASTRSLQLSRHVAFHTVTLLSAGIYLILMALIGYFIRYLGGDWGGVLQITFLCAAGLLLLALLFSGSIRARTRVWLSKNFFSYKYDYRTEWLQFTQAIAAGSDNVPEDIIKAMSALTKSPGGLLWVRTENNQFELGANLGMTKPEGQTELEALPDWLEQTEWVIDLQEWRNAPDIYNKLELPQFFSDIPRAWLIIPLMFGSHLQGILLLRESDLQPEINWEDRDLLKVAGRQAASHLAQYAANKALVNSRQFEAFNRLSAYVIHDLKNILAQQSLIVSNAEKHRDNPAFVDDVIDTVRNSVERMTRLMLQMRSGERGQSLELVDLAAVVSEAVANRQSAPPNPTLKTSNEPLLIETDREQLLTVFTHIIQNAQEASEKSGRVSVNLYRDGSNAIVEIEDCGVGMSDEFLRNRLFKPFDSTKGLTGMGIGVFESREFLRGLNGDIVATSTPGKGSLFRIVLPCQQNTPKTILTNKETMGD